MALLDILQEIKNETGPMFKSLFIMPVSLRSRLRIKEVLDKDEYKQEVDLLLKAVGSSYFSQINVSSEKPKVIREVIEDFQKTHKVSEEDAVRIIGYFATLLDCKMPKEYSLSVPATKGSSDDLARKAALDALMATGKQPIPPKPVVQQASTLPAPQQVPTHDSRLEGRIDKLEARIEDCVKKLNTIQEQRPQIETNPQAQDLSKNSVIAELQAKNQALTNDVNTFSEKIKNLTTRMTAYEQKPAVSPQVPTQDSKLEGRIDKLEARIEDYVKKLSAIQEQRPQIETSPQTQDSLGKIYDPRKKDQDLEADFDERIEKLECAISKLSDANSQASIQALISQALTDSLGDIQEQIQNNVLIQAQANDIVELKNNKTSIERQLTEISNYQQGITDKQDELFHKLEALEKQQTEKEQKLSESINTTNNIVKNSVVPSLVDKDKKLKELETTVEQLNAAISKLPNNELIQAQAKDILELKNNKTSIEEQLMKISNYREGITKSQDELSDRLKALEKQQTEKEQKLSESINTTNSIVKNSVVPSLVDKDKKLKELEATVEQLNAAISKLSEANSQASIQALISQAWNNLQSDIQTLVQTGLQQYRTNIEGQLSQISKFLQDANLLGITKNQTALSDRLKALEEQQMQLERLEAELKRLGSIQNTNKPASAASSISEPVVTKSASKSIAASSPEKQPVNTQIIEAFNQWAAKPSGKLPPDLYYIANAMRIRTECELASSPSETKWVVNRTAPFYLFPNPNMFTPQTDISDFYELDMPRLKPKGQNRIKITEPCEMTERGYVTYPGKLDILN